jgi:hypothetical protein
MTVYLPAGSFGRLTESCLPALPIGCRSDLSTRTPCESSTSILLKPGSTPSVNVIVTSGGADGKLLLIGGLARCR